MPNITRTPLKNTEVNKLFALFYNWDCGRTIVCGDLRGECTQVLRVSWACHTIHIWSRKSKWRKKQSVLIAEQVLDYTTGYENGRTT